MSLIVERLKTCLDKNKVPYHLVHHRPDYSAQDAAADTHTPGHKFLKPVVVGIGDPQAYVMIVIPADMYVDLFKVAAWFDVNKVRVVSEQELLELFPDCEVGAESPWGNLHGIPVFVDPSLEDNDIVTFNAGSHDTAIRVHWADYARLVRPESCPVGTK